jgi:4-aminobutyrate aminotransferase-like enzyme/Ser/Thr protein kinase RdoA (MazF antagonist)/murein DD-endopeptidase MepM/ murein hydrolase activator NlpD
MTVGLAALESAAAALLPGYRDLVPLPGERDLNARVCSADGLPAVLKLAAADADPDRLELEDAVLRHLAGRALPVRTPALLGRAAMDVEGRPRVARMLTWIDGAPWTDRPLSDIDLRGVGAAVAALDAALAGFDHPALAVPHRWSMPAAGQLSFDPARLPAQCREFTVAAMGRFRNQLGAVLDRLPSQAIHNDANEHNVLVDDNGAPAGLIDFGDVDRAPRVCGLATLCAYAVLHAGDDLLAPVLPLVAGYHREAPLTVAEVAILPGLIATRLAMSVVNAVRQGDDDPGNAYLQVSQGPIRRVAPRLGEALGALAVCRLRDACGYPAVPESRTVVAWLSSAAADPAPVVAAARPDAKVLVLPADADLTAAAALPDGVDLAVGRYGEDRPVYTVDEFAGADGERRTVHLGLDLFVPAGEPVYAPFDGDVVAVAVRPAALDYGGTLLLRHETSNGAPFWLLLGHLAREVTTRVRPGQRVARGERVATVGAPDENGGWQPHPHVQLFTTLLGRSHDLPGVARRSERDVWQSISPDPNLVCRLPIEPAPAQRDRDWIVSRRGTNLSATLSLSYATPLSIVAGEGAELIDSAGRRYLDLVNNVAHVGHCHSRVTAALTEQARILNTNTRYLHPAIAEYARRLVALFPDPLSVVFLVNSGSEANDLALRLARTHTGRDVVLALEHAYHGHTDALIQVSHYKFARPGGAGAGRRVRVCRLPDPYRGEHGDNGLAYAEEVARHSQGAAAFLHESIPGVAGQVELATGYLAAAYAYARAAGAVCIADEVQCGFGRVGDAMWAFERHGVVPDVVTLGKPIGNGHPLAAVVTTPEIARSFLTGMEYFNTFGGNPVSCTIGLAVLDTIRDERLMANAADVGGHLAAGLRELQRRHACIGDVRGRGLFLGVDLVTDRSTREPASERARAVVEAAVARRVLLSADGPGANVLKIKPPLVITEREADRALHVLDGALTG